VSRRFVLTGTALAASSLLLPITDLRRDARWYEQGALAARCCDCLLSRNSVEEWNRGSWCSKPGRRHAGGDRSIGAAICNGFDRRSRKSPRDHRYRL